MALGSTSARDDRRRRVLNEETMAAAGPTVDSTAANDGPSYSAGAASANQPRVVDLVPRRYTTIALAMICAIGIVVALEYLHVRFAATAEGTTIAALDLAAPGSLAVWFSSAMLMLASAMSVLIYSVRRHKTDDFRGRYRIWPWAALGWVTLSINVTAPMQGAYVDLMTRLTGWTAGPDGAFWWLTPAAIIFGAIAVRVLLDVRECRTAFGLIVLSLAAWAASLATHFAWLPTPAWATSTMIVAGAAMGGYVFLLTGLVFYARYVLLDAQGLVPRRERKRTDEASEPTETPARKKKRSQLKVDPPHTTKAPTFETASPVDHERGTQWVDGSQSDDDEDDSSPKRRRLSKSERKRLRKLKSQQRQRQR